MEYLMVFIIVVLGDFALYMGNNINETHKSH